MRGEGTPRTAIAISIAPVESGAEVMIERDATTARSDGQLYLVTVVHCSIQILSEIIFNLPFLSPNGRNSGQRFPDVNTVSTGSFRPNYFSTRFDSIPAP